MRELREVQFFRDIDARVRRHWEMGFDPSQLVLKLSRYWENLNRRGIAGSTSAIIDDQYVGAFGCVPIRWVNAPWDASKLTLD